MNWKITEIRRAIVRAAEDLWSRNIKDVYGAGPIPEITELFDVAGWGDWLRDPDLGGCPNGYERPPDPDYCGHTYSWCARKVGDYIEPARCVNFTVDPALPAEVFPSTYRLHAAQKWKNAGYDQPDPVEPKRLQAGDIAIVRPTESKPYGTHIVIPISGPNQNGTYRTIEGNATGGRADGTEGKGVVKRTRTVDETTRVWPIRPDMFIQP